MTTTFTTWTVLYTAMLDQLASGNINIGTVTRGDKTITYKSNKEFWEMLSQVELKAKAESGSFVPRTYAKQGGRGV